MHLGISWGWEHGLHGGCHSGGRLHCGMLDRAHKVVSCLSQELPSTSLLPLRGRKLSTKCLGGCAGSGLCGGHHCTSGGVGQLLQPLRGLLPHPVKRCSQELTCPGLLPFSGNELSTECLRGRTGSGLRGGHHSPGGGVHQLLQPLRGLRLSPVNPHHGTHQAVNDSLRTAPSKHTAHGLHTVHSVRTAQELGLVGGKLPRWDRLASGQISTSH